MAVRGFRFPSLVPACALAVVLCAPPVLAQPQGQTPPPPPPGQGQGYGQGQGQGQRHGHPPPPQAYEDCRGKKAGDTVPHTTPNGKVPATCENSPEGLVARPHQPPPPAPPPPGPPPAPPGGMANPRP